MINAWATFRYSRGNTFLITFQPWKCQNDRFILVKNRFLTLSQQVSGHWVDFGQKRYYYYGRGSHPLAGMLVLPRVFRCGCWGGDIPNFSPEGKTEVSLALLREIRGRRWSVLARNHCQLVGTPKTNNSHASGVGESFCLLVA